MNSKKFIWVTFQRKGFHKYVQAGTDEKLKDVSYLADRHRHLFKFKVWIEVYHDDRELEFHQFLNWLESLYDSSAIELNHKSCEMLSDDLYQFIAEKYPIRDIKIEVSEDGECGSFIEYRKV